MRYLVTGCAGFIASKVCEMLLAKPGNVVFGIDSINDYYDVRLKHVRLSGLLGRPVGPAKDWKLGLRPGGTVRSRDGRFTFIQADTADRPALARVFRLAARKGSPPFDHVLNLAARAGVAPSRLRPVDYLRSNTEGVINVLEEMKSAGCRSHVLASTSSAYGWGCRPPFREDQSASRPISPYSASKIAAELLCHSYWANEGIRSTVVRYFTVYGPAGRPDMSVFRFIEGVRRGTAITVTGDGKQNRDFTYVDDIARGTILAAHRWKDRKEGHRVINLGGGKRPTTINALIAEIERQVGAKDYVRLGDARDRSDMQSTQADRRKALRELGWAPKVDLPEGLRRTVAWHRAHTALCGSVDVGKAAAVRKRRG
ncbi:MAG: NAD-dependent epimerase/dehydratase family protein [Opitutia bacterium]|jgi:UDP-glucuronate 4-epimerase